MAESRSWRFQARGWIGILALLPLAFVAATSSPPVREDSTLDLVLDALAWGCWIAGGGLRFWATLYVGGRKSREVVSAGPYSICRHPLYLGSFFLAVSVGLFLDSLVLAAGILAAVSGYALFTVPAEERYLRERLGEAYARYCESVPRFLPRLRGFQTAALLEVRVKSLRTECLRAAGWAFIPVLLETLSHLRERPWWPHWFTLP
ncbi:MAG TPA: isoprenylcysteine carboxylmethyltransferase family protein [Planctomycetota bacterium]|jgi:protein-S-isoprenylcysteine O-methyltransferase Ste14|nr:isoprenylcysteine carboxylmethyltransferase family protein [Planctomycetota bacterium]